MGRSLALAGSVLLQELYGFNPERACRQVERIVRCQGLLDDLLGSGKCGRKKPALISTDDLVTACNENDHRVAKRREVSRWPEPITHEPRRDEREMAACDGSDVGERSNEKQASDDARASACDARSHSGAQALAKQPHHTLFSRERVHCLQCCVDESVKRGLAGSRPIPGVLEQCYIDPERRERASVVSPVQCVPCVAMQHKNHGMRLRRRVRRAPTKKSA